MNDTWIATHSGKRVFPLLMIPEDIDIDDIAHSLSMKVRFTGHANVFYSIAQHSVLVSMHCDNALTGLLHDAAEAYLPDISRPIKNAFLEFAEVEARGNQCIAKVFGIDYPFPDDVKRADLRALATEKRDLNSAWTMPWPQTQGIYPFEDKIDPWTWGKAKYEFLARFSAIRALESHQEDLFSG